MIIGLTGGIGSGKSTVARMLEEHGAIVWNADQETHNLYRHDIEMVAFVLQNFPKAVTKEFSIDRKILGDIVFNDGEALGRLTGKVGEKLRVGLDLFLSDNKDTPIALLDVPLLFESGWNELCDRVIVVHCSPENQRERVLKRGTTPEKYEQIVSLQMPTQDRLNRAHFGVCTDKTMEETRAEIATIAASLI